MGLYAENRCQEVQQSDLAEPECRSAQNPSVEPPGENTRAIEFQQLFDFECRRLGRPESVVPRCSGGNAPELRPACRRVLGRWGTSTMARPPSSSTFQMLRNAPMIIGKMLDDVQADYGVK